MHHSAIVALVLISMGLLFCAEGAVTYTPIITIRQGQLKGFEETSTNGKLIYSFKGIPYAKPPVANLRFEDPVEHVRWSGVLEATRDPNPCVQNNPYTSQTVVTPFGLEDCLYLNVFTPKPVGHNIYLPVMVYIHGGGWVYGAAADYPPYVLLNEDIVLVIIQYRLGVFGFLSTEDSALRGNLGLKDQRMALQWVQKNIGRFGGNPNKVTIFGESAGAASAHLHMLSPGSAGLFHGAIAQSGTALCPWAVGKKHRTNAAKLGEVTNCMLRGSSGAFKMCLKSISAYTLHLQSLLVYQWGTTPFVYSPRVDGDFLPDQPINLLKSGRYNKVNLINGVNRDEGALFVSLLFLYPSWTQSLIANIPVNGPLSLLVQDEPNASNLATKIYNYYLQGKTLENLPVNELVKMLTDIYFNIGSDYADFLHSQDKQMNLYLYELDYKGQNSITDPFRLGFQYISHVDELFYLFSGGPFFGQYPALPPQDIEVRTIMSKMWTNFAKYGVPTPPEAYNFHWSPTTSYSYGHLNITRTPRMMGYSRSQVLQFWFSLDTTLNRQLLHDLPRPKI